MQIWLRLITSRPIFYMISDNPNVSLRIVDCSLYTRRIALMDDYHKKRMDMLAYTPVEFNYFKEIVQDIGVAVLIDENLLKFYHSWDVSTVEVVFLKTAWPLPSRSQFKSFELYRSFGLKNHFLKNLSQNSDVRKATIFGIIIDSSRTSNSWCSVTTCLISCIMVSSKRFILWE